MPTVATFSNFKIVVYAPPREHGPPHFHVLTNEANAVFWIDSLKHHKGKLPASVEKVALAWAKINQALLQQEWDKLHTPRKKP